jgi:hypothetical protein
MFSKRFFQWSQYDEKPEFRNEVRNGNKRKKEYYQAFKDARLRAKRFVVSDHDRG